MFEVTKHARMEKAKAEKTYGPLTLANTNLVGSYYVWPFPVEIIGAGETVPDDYDPTKRYRFKILDTYGVEDMILDIRTLEVKHGVARLARSLSRGLDLELRDDSKPPMVGKMNDAKKQAWVIAHAGDQLFAAMTTKGGPLTPADYITLYNELHAETTPADSDS